MAPGTRLAELRPMYQLISLDQMHPPLAILPEAWPLRLEKASNPCQFTASPLLASFMTGKGPAMVPESSRTDIGRPMVFRQMHSQWFPSQESGSPKVAAPKSEHYEFQNSESPGPICPISHE